MSTITNSKFFNNVGAGIEIGGIYYRVLLNNMQVFNNNYGIYFNSYDDKYYVAINNSQIYNNNYDGVYIQKSDHTVLNNCQIYNNTDNGVAFVGELNTS